MNFHYAISLANTLYDITGDIEDLEEIGLIAYNFIGNKNTRLLKAILDVDCETGSVDLPCDADLIEAVTYCGPEDAEYVSNTYNYGNQRKIFAENYIESQKAFLDPEYISGKYVKYKRVGNKIYVNKGLGKILILYHSILLDDEGLPEINDKEAIAIADYIAYTIKYKEALRTNNGNLLNLAKEIKQQWLFHCDAARVPEYISQELMDLALNVLASSNRKVYNRSYKPIM